MIPCRLFTRVYTVWKSPCVAAALSNPSCLPQGCFHKHTLSYLPKLGGAKDGSNGIDQHKKRKVIVPAWKPVCTMSGNVEDSKGSDVGCHDDASSCISSSHISTQDELIAGSSVSSVTSAGDTGHNKPSEKLEEKQSISVTCEMENMSGSAGGSRSSEVLCQEIVIEETLHNLGSGNKAELMNVVKNHSISVQVDASLIRFVKGKWGSTQRRIEEETGVKIIFQTSKEETTIVIEGSSIESVTEASKKIEIIIEQAVKSPSLDYSHFISLPLAIHPDLIEKLQNFQNSILGEAKSSQEGNPESEPDEDTSDDRENENKVDSPKVAVKLDIQDDKEHVRVKIGTSGSKIGANELSRASTLSDLGIDKSIFIKPKTFHLTVLMLKLWNKERIAAATEVLQKIMPKVMDALDNRPVSIRLKGLECMKGSPAKARVLYAPVEEIGGEGRLLRACQVIIEAYVEAGLVLEKDAQQPLKLHATLMNVRHRKRKSRNRRYDSFDACDIFRRFGSEEWGDYLIREAHLSQRFVFNEIGYYHCCVSILFPEKMQIEGFLPES